MQERRVALRDDEREPDLREVGVTVGHHGEPDAGHLGHRGERRDEEQHASQHHPRAAKAPERRRDDHRQDSGGGEERRRPRLGRVRIGIEGRQLPGGDELDQVHHEAVRGDEQFPRDAQCMQRPDRDEVRLDPQREDSERDRERDERQLLDEDRSRPQAPALQIVHREQQEWRGDRGGLGQQREHTQTHDLEVPHAPPGARPNVADVGREGEQHEEGAEDVLPLRDPGHGLHAHGMDGEQQRPRERGLPHAAAEREQEVEDEHAVQQVEQQIGGEVDPRGEPRQQIVRLEAPDRQRMIVEGHG